MFFIVYVMLAFALLLLDKLGTLSMLNLTINQKLILKFKCEILNLTAIVIDFVVNNLILFIK